MSFSTIAGCIMLLIGLGGIGTGLYWRALRKAAHPEAVAAQVQSNLALLPQVAQPGEALGAATVSSLTLVDETHRSPRATELNASYVRVRFAAWLADPTLAPEVRSRAAAVMEQHAAVLQRLDAQAVGAFPADILENDRRALISELMDAMRPVLDEREIINFQRELAWREVNLAIDELGAVLHLQDRRLSAGQIMRLRSTLLESRPPEAQGAAVIDLATTDWNNAITQSAEFLSSEQLEQLRAFAKKSEFDRQYRTLVRLPTGHFIPGL